MYRSQHQNAPRGTATSNYSRPSSGLNSFNFSPGCSSSALHFNPAAVPRSPPLGPRHLPSIRPHLPFFQAPYQGHYSHYPGPLIPGQLVPRPPPPIHAPPHSKKSSHDCSNPVQHLAQPNDELASSPNLGCYHPIRKLLPYPSGPFGPPFSPQVPNPPPPSSYRIQGASALASAHSSFWSPSPSLTLQEACSAVVVSSPPPPMSSSVSFGGLAALQTSERPKPGAASYYSHHAPAYSDTRTRRDSNNSNASNSRYLPIARGSGGSTASTSGRSTSPCTPLTTPNESFADHHKNSNQRASADSYSRSSQLAFAYSDQLKSPNLGMSDLAAPPTASEGEATKQELSSVESVSGFMNADADSTDNSPIKERNAKKTNPLQDLIETETAYVAELGRIIRRVAAAWSRSNLPPPELDTMFRNVEAIYRVNRAFLKSLRDIGPSPSSPRALGDLLMRWIDDLEVPYSRYCGNYFVDFDSWPGVQGNAKLPELLLEISATTNADGTPVLCSDRKRPAGVVWTLDSLFALPQGRLRYYKKLYSRLLKSTHPGRSDHRLLVGANDKLDELLEKSAKKISMGLLDDSPASARARGEETGRSAQQGEEKGRGPLASSSSSLTSHNNATTTPPFKGLAAKLGKLDFSNTALGDLDMPATPGSNEPPLSPLIVGQQIRPPPLMTVTLSTSSPSLPSETATTAGAMLAPADDLERTLDVERVLDIFTMRPKKCQLRINPPTLPFKRELRRSADVIIDFVPQCTGLQVSWRRGHLFLLTDLFLVCERMTPDESKAKSAGASGMWLLFPPLAGKHLQVLDAPGTGNALLVTILKKETLRIELASTEEKKDWLLAFEDCHAFASNLAPRVDTTTSTAANKGSSPLGGVPIQAAAVTPNANVNRGLGLSSQSSASNGVGSPASPANLPGSWPSFTETPPVQSSRLALASRPPIGGRSASSTSTSTLPAGNNGPRATHGSEGLLQSPPADALAHSAPSLGLLSRVASPISLSDPSVIIDGDSIFGRPFVGGPAMIQKAPTTHPPRPLPERAATVGSFAGSPAPHSPTGKGQLLRQQAQRSHNLNDDQMTRPPQSLPAKSNHGLYENVGGPSRSPSFPLVAKRSDTPLSMGNGRQSPHSGGQHGPPGPGTAGPRHHPLPGVPSRSFVKSHDREPSRHPSAPNLREQVQRSAGMPAVTRTRSVSSAKSNSAFKLPSEMMKDGDLNATPEYSPPSSPVLKATGPTSSTISAQMRCRLYLKQGHGQWKSLGNARLKLYHLLPADQRQLVVENDRKTLVSTIILADGVERVGKVGVAVEISDVGKHTGIIYMLQMRSEESAQGLFGELIDGGGRTIAI